MSKIFLSIEEYQNFKSSWIDILVLNFNFAKMIIFLLKKIPKYFWKLILQNCENVSHKKIALKKTIPFFEMPPILFFLFF